jgi:carbon storage regulator CsrA
MLILTRKLDQAIVIQGNITIVVLGVERDRVKLGIAAPAEVSVLRQELMEENKAPPAPSPLRRRNPRPSLTPTQGSLALKRDE